MRKKIGNYEGEDLYLFVGNYANNKRLYLELLTDEDEDYANVSINLPDIGIAESYVYLSNEIDDNLKQFLIDNKVISDTIVMMKYNHGEYRMVKWNKNTIKELDPEGYAMYQKEIQSYKEL